MLTNISNLVIQANISYSSNRIVNLLYQTQALVINGYAKFSNLTVSNYSNSIVIIFSCLEISQIQRYVLYILFGVPSTTNIHVAFLEIRFFVFAL